VALLVILLVIRAPAAPRAQPTDGRR
jgi:hypothetical protein